MYLTTHYEINRFPRKKMLITSNELKNKYISLRKFLAESEYIGRKAHRTKATIHGDTSFMSNEENRYLVMLYRGNNHLIIENVSNGIGKQERTIEILNGSYADDNWDYADHQEDIYKDSNDMYLAIQKKILDEQFKEVEQRKK
jgi:hypothetical protein